MSIAEFDALRAEDERQYELHEGQLVEVTNPDWVHTYLQKRLNSLLEARIGNLGMVTIEMPFQISQATRQTKRRADVAFVLDERSRQAMSMGYLEGVPDLVVEVLSPSNSASKLNRDARLFLANGATEFWVVDYDTKTVHVRHKDRTEREYELGEAIPLCFASGSIAVSDVFQDL